MGAPLDILATGMVTGVGFSAPASCAAIRCAIDGFNETRFMFDGEWLIGCPVPFEEGWRGRERLLQMVVPAIAECLSGVPPTAPEKTALLVCLAEEDRPGRLAGLDDSMLAEVQSRLGVRFHSSSKVLSAGRVGGVDALKLARELAGKGPQSVIVAGVDSYLVGETLTWLHQRRRILTASNSDGFIPGEAAAAVLLAPAREPSAGGLRCVGLGFGAEPAPLDSEKPLRADGLVQAIRGALADASTSFEQLDYRLADVSGAQYSFKEAALAIGRTVRPVKPQFPLWHPADCTGEVGAAAVPLILAVAEAAARKRYAPGAGVLCHFAADGERRAALVLRSTPQRSAA